MRRGRGRVLAPAVLVAVAFGAAACSSKPQTLRDRVTSWSSSVGYASLEQAVVADLGDLHTGEKQRNLFELRTACAGFSQDADALYSELPTPIVEVTNELGSSLTTFSNAGFACYSASSLTSANYEKFLRLVRSATPVFDNATNELASLGAG